MSVNESNRSKTELSTAVKARDGVMFLGFTFRVTQTGKILRLIDPRNVKRERKRLERQLDREQAEIEKQGFAPAAPQSQKKLPPELESLFNRFKSEMKND